MADGFIVHGRLIVGLDAHQMSLEEATDAGHVVTAARAVPIVRAPM